MGIDPHCLKPDDCWRRIISRVTLKCNFLSSYLSSQIFIAVKLSPQNSQFKCYLISCFWTSDLAAFKANSFRKDSRCMTKIKYLNGGGVSHAKIPWSKLNK